MAKRGRPFGFKVSEETKAKTSRALTGRVFSEESRKRLSEGQKRRWSKAGSEAERERLSTLFKGRRHSPETKAKMSKAKLGTKHTDETKAKIGASVSEAKAQRRAEIEALWLRLKENKSETG